MCLSLLRLDAVLINLILLCVASTMSTNHMDISIIPQFPIAKTGFPGNHSFGVVVDFLLTKLPEKYTGVGNCRLGCRVLIPFHNFYADPIGILANTDEIKGTLTSNIFEAKRDKVRAALPPHHIVNLGPYPKEASRIGKFFCKQVQSSCSYRPCRLQMEKSPESSVDLTPKDEDKSELEPQFNQSNPTLRV